MSSFAQQSVSRPRKQGVPIPSVQGPQSSENGQSLETLMGNSAMMDKLTEVAEEALDPVQKKEKPELDSKKTVVDAAKPVTEVVKPSTEAARPATEQAVPEVAKKEPIVADAVVAKAEPVVEKAEPVVEKVDPVLAAADVAKKDPPVAREDVKGVRGDILRKHAGKTDDLERTTTPAQDQDLLLFRANYEKNKARYQAVANRANVPPALVAAIHWRESTGDFGTYLHQGDPLGKKAVNEPNDIPVMDNWEDAAVHALSMKDKAATGSAFGLDATTTDAATLAAYAEMYNGTGYHDRGIASPYVYSGTDEYQKGKYVSDGKFSKNAKDQQLGVMVMLDSIGGMDAKVKPATKKPDAKTGWDSVIDGRVLQKGASGPLIKMLQTKLSAAGFACGNDGKFGPDVEKAVREFQAANGLAVDGQVGKGTAEKLGKTNAEAPGAVEKAVPSTPTVKPKQDAAKKVT